MVSKTAQADIEDMWEQGLKPSVGDIVRLNALGVKLERCTKPDNNIFNARRCAFLGEGIARICFMQPTIAHDIWRDKVEKIVDFDDMETSIATDAFTCATEYDKLPEPTDADAVKTSIQKFLQTLSPYTLNQITAAILYCTNGTDWMNGEYAPPNPNKEHDYDDDDSEFESISLGIMLGGISIGIGLSLAEAQTLTRSQFLSMVCRRTNYESGVDKKQLKSDNEDNYLRTLDEITSRLKKENEGVMKNG